MRIAKFLLENPFKEQTGIAMLCNQVAGCGFDTHTHVLESDIDSIERQGKPLKESGLC